VAATQARYNTDTSDMLIPHGMFRAVLRNPADIINAHTGSDSRDGVSASQSYFDNVLRFLDAHHGGEDELVWPLLTERCAEARELIGSMESQHEGIHRAREQCGTALDAWSASPDQASATKLIDSLGALHGEIDRHFAQEEAEILPLASANMSQEEWGALPGHAMAHFTGDKIWLILGLIFEQMNADQLAFTMSLLPPPVVEMWNGSGHAAFDDFVGRVRGTDANQARRT